MGACGFHNEFSIQLTCMPLNEIDAVTGVGLQIPDVLSFPTQISKQCYTDESWERLTIQYSYRISQPIARTVPPSDKSSNSERPCERTSHRDPNSCSKWSSVIFGNCSFRSMRHCVEFLVQGIGATTIHGNECSAASSTAIGARKLWVSIAVQSDIPH